MSAGFEMIDTLSHTAECPFAGLCLSQFNGIFVGWESLSKESVIIQLEMFSEFSSKYFEHFFFQNLYLKPTILE